MIIHKAFHARNEIGWLYKSGKKEEVVSPGVKRTSIQWCEDYTKASIERERERERVITVIRNSTENIKINRTITWKEKLYEKIYGHVRRQSNEISHETWTWRRNGNYKRETKSLLIKILDKTQQNNKYRSCSDWNETVNLIISKCR